ncbi:hypothetical protein C8J57DRAFT_1476947 [Mycena rebaudengoi]|nr:hypothetical protein C8J57DRAFT_1476947 [Mycena rebaudengoi]
MPDAENTEDGPGENNVRRTFQMPDPTATREEILEALRAAQLEAARLLSDNRDLQIKISQLTKKGPAGKKRRVVNLDEDNTNGYLDVIVDLGKSFAIMVEPWVHSAIFTGERYELPADIEQIFKESKLYNQFLTVALYNHVPEKYHEMIDAAVFPNFAANFCKHANAGRSSALFSAGESALLHILSDLKIDTPAAKRALLFWPTEPVDAIKVGRLPPFLYANLKKDASKMFLHRGPMMFLRAALLGPASIKDNGTKKPVGKPVGLQWTAAQKGVTAGAIAFGIIGFMNKLSADSSLEEKGKTTSIPYQDYFRLYKKLLSLHPDAPNTVKIFKKWNQAVFAGVTSVLQVETQDPVDDDAESGLEDAFAHLAVGDDSDDDDALRDINGADTVGLMGNDAGSAAGDGREWSDSDTGAADGDGDGAAGAHAGEGDVADPPSPPVRRVGSRARVPRTIEAPIVEPVARRGRGKAPRR